MTRYTRNNCLLIHGGGLCPDSNAYLSRLAEELKDADLFERVFMGFYSFEALIKPEENIKEWNLKLKDEARKAKGGFYGTHRTVNLADTELQKIALETCKKMGIEWIFIAGGDGSSRQASEIADIFEANGVKLCIPMPLTVDGIEGGMSLGIRPAVAESLSILENLCATNFMTKDSKDGDGFSICLLETQGRNRDDILAGLLKAISEKETLGGILKDDIDIYALSANYEWSIDNLIDKTIHSTRRTLILVSEGAEDKVKDLKKDIKQRYKEGHRKVRTSAVGYLTQMNDMMDPLEKNAIRQSISTGMPCIVEGMERGKSFSLVYESLYSTPAVESIDYYAGLNPREGQQATLSKELEALIKVYAP